MRPTPRRSRPTRASARGSPSADGRTAPRPRPATDEGQGQLPRQPLRRAPERVRKITVSPSLTPVGVPWRSPSRPRRTCWPFSRATPVGVARELRDRPSTAGTGAASASSVGPHPRGHRVALHPTDVSRYSAFVPLPLASPLRRRAVVLLRCAACRGRPGPIPPAGLPPALGELLREMAEDEARESVVPHPLRLLDPEGAKHPLPHLLFTTERAISVSPTRVTSRRGMIPLALHRRHARLRATPDPTRYDRLHGVGQALRLRPAADVRDRLRQLRGRRPDRCITAGSEVTS